MKRTGISRGKGFKPRTSNLRRAALLRQSALTRTAAIKAAVRKPFTSKSKPVTSEEKRARDLVRARSNGVCEGCDSARATDWAHRIGRGQGGPWCPSNGLALCGPDGCHRWSHDHVPAARSVGWILRSGQDPAATPALLHGRGWVLLTPDGLYLPTERTAA